MGEATHRIEGSFADLGVDERLLKGLESMGYSGPTPVQKRAGNPALKVKTSWSNQRQDRENNRFRLAFARSAVGPEAQPKQPRGTHPWTHPRSWSNRLLENSRGLRRARTLRSSPAMEGVSLGIRSTPSSGDLAWWYTPDDCSTTCVEATWIWMHAKRSVWMKPTRCLAWASWEEVTSILKRLPSENDRSCCSPATLPERIQKASSQFMDQPKHVDLGGEVRTVLGVTHRLYPPRHRHEPNPESSAHARGRCAHKRHRLLQSARGSGFGGKLFAPAVLELHAHPRRHAAKARERALESVRGGRSRLLIATDVAAFGIDIRGLDAVFHFDLPQDAELYVHRAGRTGRIGASGLSAVLLTRSGGIKTRAIKARYAVTFEESTMPDKETSVAAQAERVIADLTAAGADLPLEQFMDLAQGISDSPDAAQAIAYLLFEQTKRQKSTGSRNRDRKRDQVALVAAAVVSPATSSTAMKAMKPPRWLPSLKLSGMQVDQVTVEASHRAAGWRTFPATRKHPVAELKMGEFEVAIRRMKPPGRDRQPETALMNQQLRPQPGAAKLEAKLADSDLEQHHRDVLQCTRNFKMGWVALGRSLRSVSQRRLYRQWNTPTSKASAQRSWVCAGRPLKSSCAAPATSERHAPNYYGDEAPIGAKTVAPDLRAVDLLARAEEKNLFASHEGLQESLHSGCFEEGVSPAALGRLAARALDEGGREVLGLRQPPPEDPNRARL